MNSRLGPEHPAPAGVLDLADADAGDRREVAGHERQHAGGEERDEAGDEGDRDVGAGYGIVSSGRRSVERRREAAPVLARELVRRRPSSVKMPTIARRIRSRRSGSGSAAIAVLKPLERGLGSPASQAAKASASWAAASASTSPLPREPRPRRQSLGEEVAGQRLEQLERLLVLAALEQHPPEPVAAPNGAGRSRAPRAATPRRRPRRARRRGRGRGRRGTLSISAGGIAPVNSATTLPSRNAFTAGIPWTPKLAASAWFASTSTFASSTLPARLATAASSAGPS